MRSPTTRTETTTAPLEPDRGYPLRDVRRLAPELLRVEAGEVCLGLRYRAHWDDDYGARGWKLMANLADPEIIASTRETGATLPTSVLVHDALDHLVSGFAASGHRAEAMALAQLARRTGSDPTPDYRQMIREDLLNGQVVGERAATFIGATLRARCTPGIALDDDRAVMVDLRRRLGDAALTAALVERFRTLGALGHRHALRSWERLGLAAECRAPLGLAMQAVLECIDRVAEDGHLPRWRGELRLSGQRCRFVPSGP